MYAIAKEAKPTPTLEDGTVLNPKRVDIACTNHEQAELWALDVVVADAQNPSHCGPQQLKDPGCPATAEKTDKEAAYKEALAITGREGIKLRPLAIETMGLMGEGLQSFISSQAICLAPHRRTSLRSLR